MRTAASVWLTLCNTRQFAAVMQHGQVIVRSKHFVLHALHLHSSQVRELSFTEMYSGGKQLGIATIFPNAHTTSCYCGAIVPKRWARRAVTRNLVKRQIRHIMSNHAPLLPAGLAIVVRQRAMFDSNRFTSASSLALRQAVRHELLSLFSKADWSAVVNLSTMAVSETQAQRPIWRQASVL